ncbi:ferritin-like domain-containing protein [Streptomyces sp. NPDC053048]|uniref:ferritin-like domain-containing protein n=1 Tax=Streptomyces sp. NPDC053048 TaxID=3365694 RepID=UPI0037D18C4D
MSVFDLPRLHFAGVATAKPPTGPRGGLVDLATGRALTDDGPFPAERPATEYHDWLQRRGPHFDASGRARPDGEFSAAKGWNFDGNGHFWITAEVVSVEGPRSRPDAPPDTADPVVGRAVDFWGHYNEYLRTTVNRARVFDLDPASAWTTALMIGQFGFGRLGRSHDDGYMLTGAVHGLQPPRWVDFGRVLDVGEHALARQLGYCAVHQFVVTPPGGPAGPGRVRWVGTGPATPGTAPRRVVASPEYAQYAGDAPPCDPPPATAGRCPQHQTPQDPHRPTGHALGWLPDSNLSPAVGALREAVEGGADGLVVRFALDNMASPPAPNAPGQWRVRGTIAPWHAGELRSYPAGRLLVPASGADGTLHHMTVEVARDRACFDMISAVPVTSRAREAGPGPLHRLGPPLDAGDLELRTARSGRLIARVPAGTYPSDATSGIVTVAAEPGWEAAADEALCLTGTPPGAQGRVALLTERETHVQTDDALLVLHHRDRAGDRDHAVGVPLRSFVRGRPAGVEGIHVRQYFNPRALPADPVAGAAPARCGDAVVLGMRDEGPYAADCVVATDEHGRGLLTLRGERAGTCRVLLATDPADLPPVDPAAPGSARAAYDDEDALGFWAGAGWLAVRVLPDDWHLDRVPRSDVDFALLHREVFAFYEHVSSFMRSEVFSLADRCKVETYAELVWQMCDPRNKEKTYYMPPTRDLTDPKARLLLAYLRNQQARSRPPVTAPAVLGGEPAITTRGELYRVLQQAAALELAVMLQYLYAAFSVPTHGAGREYVRRGQWTAEQLEIACGHGGATLDDGIRGVLLNVAREEMIHFLLVNNIITAMGEPFHIPLIDFATIGEELPVPLDFALEGLSTGSVQRYVAIEQPAGLVPEVRREGGGPRGAAVRPLGFTWGSVSELYAGIREGLRRVPDVFLVEKGRGGGEHHLFMRESVNTAHPDYQLEVDDLSSALFAVDFITEQGEGGVLGGAAPSDSSHFHSFLRIGEVLAGERVPGPYGRLVPWSPAYPVLRNPTLGAGGGAKDAITDPEARAVGRLFNRSYHLMLQLMAQHFGESPDGSLRRSRLMNASIDVMTGMMRPLAELLVTMESGRRGRTAGPTFELDAPPAFTPRPDVARRSLALRFDHLSAAARKCEPVPGQVAEMMAFYADFFRRAE